VKSLSAQVFLDKNTGNIYFLNSPNHFPPFSTIFYSMFTSSLSLSLSTIFFSSTPLLKKNALAYTSALAKRLELFKVKVLLSLFLGGMVSRVASKHY
jgi:hypothetical protein